MQIEVVDDCSTQIDVERVVHEVGAGRVAFHRQARNARRDRQLQHLPRARPRPAGPRPARRRSGRARLLRGARLGIRAPPGVGAAFCRCSMIDEATGRSISRPRASRSRRGRRLIACLVVSSLIQTPGIVVRRSVYERLGGFDRARTRGLGDVAAHRGALPDLVRAPRPGALPPPPGFRHHASDAHSHERHQHPPRHRDRQRVPAAQSRGRAPGGRRSPSTATRPPTRPGACGTRGTWPPRWRSSAPASAACSRPDTGARRFDCGRPR